MEPTLTIRDSPSTTSSEPTASCTTAVPDKYGAVPFDACNSKYLYDPSFEANCAFAVLFGISLVAHIIQAVAWKKRFCWVLIMGVLWEFIAFTVKTLGTRDQQEMAYMIIGQIFFLLAPLWTNAFVFMTVARLVYYVLPDQTLCRIKAIKLTRYFVCIDILCFLVQGMAGSMMSQEDNTQPIVHTGQKIYMGGCGAQLGFILIFCGMMVRFYIKMRQGANPGLNMRRVKALFYVTLIVLVLIVIRIIFRLVEFGPGPSLDNPILTNEYYAIGLDALPMFLGFLLLNIVHPGWVLRGPNNEFPRLSRKEKKQLKREKKEAKQQAKEEKRERKREKKEGKKASNREQRRKFYAEHVVMNDGTHSTERMELVDRDDYDTERSNRA